MSEQNKRRFPRANYPCTVIVWLENNYETVFAQTTNISAGGILANLDLFLFVGTRVQLKVDFSKTDSFECRARVVRVQRKTMGPGEFKQIYAIAFTFEDLGDPKMSYLKEKVDKLLANEIHN